MRFLEFVVGLLKFVIVVSLFGGLMIFLYDLNEKGNIQREIHKEELHQSQEIFVKRNMEIPSSKIEEAQTKDISGLKYVREMKIFLPDSNENGRIPTYIEGAAKGYVLVDIKTGVEYLYIWGGGYRGGPAITRLWEE